MLIVLQSKFNRHTSSKLVVKYYKLIPCNIFKYLMLMF